MPTPAVRPERESQFEVLRLLAMFMVLMLHANFIALKFPVGSQFAAHPYVVTTRCLLEAASLVAVNVFVLLSGWFGIRPSLRGALNLLFTLWFYGLVLSAGGWCCGVDVSLDHVVKALNAGHGLWFIRSYLLLFILAPALNAYAEGADRRQFRALLAAFFTLAFYLGVFEKMADFNYGYSALFFCGLYLLARYIRRFCPRFTQWSGLRCAAIYGLCTVATTLLIMRPFLEAPHSRRAGIDNTFMAYDSPFLVAAALMLVLLFSRRRFRSRRVNRLAAGALAVYIVHSHFAINPWFLSTNRLIYTSFDGPLAPLLMFLFLLAVFAACLLADLVRQWCWGRLWPVVERLLRRPTAPCPAAAAPPPAPSAPLPPRAEEPSSPAP